MNQEKFFNILNSPVKVSFDVETNGLNWHTGFVCGYSVSDGTDAEYIPVRHGGGFNIENVANFEEHLSRVVATREKPLITHNGKFDSHFSLNHSIELKNNIEDTMIAAALLDENRFSFSLENVAKAFPEIPQKKGKELYQYLARRFSCEPKAAAMSHFWQLEGNDPVGSDYAKTDTMTTWHVHDKQAVTLYGENLDFVYNLENRLLHVLRKMERRGVGVDLDELGRVREELRQMMLEAECNMPLQENLLPINPNSKKDLEEYFRLHQFTDWEFTDPTEKFPKGQPSFNKLFLAKSEPGKLILQLRALLHLRNSFLDPINDYIYDGRIYTNFNQTQSEYGYGTKSGRLSSTNPNLQQIPARDVVLGKLFRRIFVPSKGFTLVEFDYSQAEPRLFSHYSAEPILIEGYNQEPAIDMHSIAAKYMGIERKVAKNLNLGLQYQMGVNKLATQLNITYNEALDMYRLWKKTFPRVDEFTKMAAEVAERRGYVKTILGRRARFNDPRFAYRAANRIVQGGSADILKYAMVKLDDWLVETNQENDIKMLLNIHDSIVWEIRDDLLDTAIPKIKSIMENVQVPPFNLKVPFKVECKSGHTWAEATYGRA